MCLVFELSEPFHLASRRRCPGPHRFDVAKLVPQSKTTSSNPVVTVYRTALTEEFVSKWNVSGNVDEKWSTLQDAIMTAARNSLGFSKRRQPDWFRESMAILQPPLELRSATY